MSLSAQASCPQCGGAVSLEVGNPVLACPFCRAGLYLCPGRPLRYRLSPSDGLDPAGLLYLPFWRLRGLRYRVLGDPPAVEGNLLDVTVPASPKLPLEATLGIRPQAARLTLLAPGSADPGWGAAARGVRAVVEARLAEVEPVRPLLSRLIGETPSLIEAPFALETAGAGWRLREALPDGAVHELGSDSAGEGLPGPGPEPAPRSAGVPFLPLLCPECGHGLEATPGAVAFVCGPCGRAWQVSGERLAPLGASVVPGKAAGVRFLPFWRLTFEAEGLPFRTRAELRRWAVSYQPVPPGWEREPPTLLVPGFKAQPRVLLRAAKALSLAPLPEPEPLAPGPAGRSEPVRLPLAEAAQAVKLVLAFLVETLRPFAEVPGARLRVTGGDLLYLPFVRAGSEWREVHSGFAVQASAVARGAAL